MATVHGPQARGNADDAQRALDAAAFTLQRFAVGGMWDVVGGGFHRYRRVPAWVRAAAGHQLGPACPAGWTA
jgi:hypothetical protein